MIIECVQDKVSGLLSFYFVLILSFLEFLSLSLFHKVSIHIKGAKEKIKDKAMLMVLKTLLHLIRLKEEKMQTHQHPYSVTQEAHVVVNDIFSDRQTYEKQICKHEVQIKRHVETLTVFCVYNICNGFCTYLVC